MAEKNSPAKKPKAIVDVAQPGTSTPDTSGKPVLVTNRPMLRDPMVVDDQASGSNKGKPGEGSVKINVTTKAKASPQAAPLESVSDTTAPEVPTVDVKEDSTVSTPAAITEEATPKPEAKPDNKAPEKTLAKPPAKADDKTEAQPKAPEDEKSSATTDEVEAIAPVPNEAEQEAAAAAKAEHSAAIQKLIDSKQYFLTINSVEKRKTQHFVILGIVLSIFLVVAWVDIALDANLIQINGIKPLTHFFSN